MDLNTINEKNAIITSLADFDAFIANNKAHINPDKLAELIVKTENLTEKVKDIFAEEIKLDEALKKYASEVTNQKTLISEQEKILSAHQGEVEEKHSDDEYEGEIEEDLLDV